MFRWVFSCLLKELQITDLLNITTQIFARQEPTFILYLQEESCFDQVGFNFPFEGTESVRVANVSWVNFETVGAWNMNDRWPNDLNKYLGVCSGNRKEPFAARQ